jgi:hypothetical protein
MLLGSLCRADEADEVAKAAQQARLEFLKSKLAELKLRDAVDSTRTISTTTRPILRWTNPIRNDEIDGAVFLWLDGQRPCAVASLFLFGKAPLHSGRFAQEFASLSATALACADNEKEVWNPNRGALIGQRLPDTTAPYDSSPRRLAQLKAIARRFEAAVYDTGNSPTQLRLLPQPLYRFRDKSAAILDGALFGFVQGNDSEALLMVEAIESTDGEKPQWRFTLARLTAAKVTVRLDGNEVFTASNYWNNPKSSSDPYIVREDKTFTLPEF